MTPKVALIRWPLITILRVLHVLPSEKRRLYCCVRYAQLSPFPAYFEDGELVVPVDLVAGRVLPDALGRVPPQHRARLHVLEAELADPDARQAREVLGVRGLVPHLKKNS